MALQLNDTLIDFFNDIQLRFEWNDKFYIDFMEYFPLLKNGLSTKNTYYKVIAAYGLMKGFILKNDIAKGVRANIIIKIYNKHIEFSEIFKILSKDFNKELLFSISTIERDVLYSNNKVLDININDDLSNESKLADSLLSIINITVDMTFFSLFYDFGSGNITSLIFDEALKNSSIRLLNDVLNNNTEDMITAFYIDEIDFYIGYIDLYNLAISRKNIKIANILKEQIIIKNLCMKQALIVCFENLIGASNIPDIVYSYVI